MLNSILSGTLDFVVRLLYLDKTRIAALSGKALLVALAVLLSTHAHAQIPSDNGHNNGRFHYSGSTVSRLYADVQWGVQAVSHSDLDFNPPFSSASLGFWLFDNVGVEVFGDTGLGSFENEDFSVEVEESSGVAMRFQSPPRKGLSLYFLAGYVDSQVAQVVNDERGVSRVSQGFAGFRLGVGLAQRLPFFDNVLVTGEYRNYFSVDELQLDSLALGLRINIQ